MTWKTRAKNLAAKPFVRNSITTAAARFIAVAMGAVGSLFLARHLGATEFGQFSFLNATLNFLLIFSVFGGDKNILRHTRAGGTTTTKFHTTFASVVGMGAMTLSLAIPVLTLTAFAGVLGTNIDPVTVVLALLVLLPLRWAGKILAPAWRIDGHALMAEFSTALVNRAAVPVALAAGFVVGLPQTGEGFFLTVAISTTLVYIPVLIAARHILITAVNHIPSPREIAATARDCMAYTVSAFSQRGFELVPVMILGLLARPEDAGVLNVALKIFLPVLLLNQAVNVNLQPRIARSVNETGLSKRIADGARAASAVGLLVVALYVALLAFVGKDLLALLGEEYIAALAPALVLIAGRAAPMLTGRNAMLINMSGHAHMLAAIQSCVLAVVTAVMLFTPDIPLIAIAGVMAAGWTAVAVGAAFVTHYKYGTVLTPLLLLSRLKNP